MKSDLPKNLHKARQLFRINVTLILLTAFMIFLSKNVIKSNSIILDFFGGIPFLGIFILAPLGLFYTWRSLSKGEGYSSLRMKYFFIHSVFCLIILAMVLAVIKDVGQLF